LTLGSNAQYNSAAIDDGSPTGYSFFTVNMRNQAQTQQVELFGSGTFSYSLGLGLSGVDSDSDGVPNDFELQYDFLDPDSNADGAADEDGDGVNNVGEYIAGTGIQNSADFPVIYSIQSDSPGIVIQFPTKAGRKYYIWYKNDTMAASTNNWTLATPVPLDGNGGVRTWTDDGSQTAPSPGDPELLRRFYKFKVEYP